MRYNNEFEKYATQHMGIGSMDLHNFKQGASASMTPYILEEREMRVTQMDIFSRMLLDRILWVFGPVNDNMMAIVQAQLQFLDNVDNKDITMQISSPGGSVLSGLGIVDVMNYITSDVVTVNMGLAASMGSILLGSGTVGKRRSLQHSRVMLHTVSSGAEGKVQDMVISLREAEKYNEVLFGLLASYTKKTKKQVLKDADRDLWLSSDEALEYGIIDAIITKKISKK